MNSKKLIVLSVAIVALLVWAVPLNDTALRLAVLIACVALGVALDRFYILVTDRKIVSEDDLFWGMERDARAMERPEPIVETARSPRARFDATTPIASDGDT